MTKERKSAPNPRAYSLNPYLYGKITKLPVHHRHPCFLGLLPTFRNRGSLAVCRRVKTGVIPLLKPDHLLLLGNRQVRVAQTSLLRPLRKYLPWTWRLQQQAECPVCMSRALNRHIHAVPEDLARGPAHENQRPVAQQKKLTFTPRISITDPGGISAGRRCSSLRVKSESHGPECL